MGNLHEVTILCAVKRPGSRLGNRKFSQCSQVLLHKVADRRLLQVLRKFEVSAELDGKAGGMNLKVVVAIVPQINLLGGQAMVELGLTDLTGHFMWHVEETKKLSVGQLTTVLPVGSLQKACKQLCQQFPDLFKSELGCLTGLSWK